MTQKINLHKVSKHFSGAILFDGHGAAKVIQADGQFCFDQVQLYDGHETIHYRFLPCDGKVIDTANFNIKNLINKEKIVTELQLDIKHLTVEQTIALADYAKSLTGR